MEKLERKAREVKAQFHYLFNNAVYSRYKETWLRIRDKQLPFLGEFPGEKRKKDWGVLDMEAWRANLIFAGGMKSGLTPQTAEWFELAFKDEALNVHHGAKKALDERKAIMLAVLSGSNFYNATHNNYMELAFGQAAIGCFADMRHGVIYDTYPIGSYAYEVDDKGLANCFAHRKKMSAIQIMGRFGRDDLPDRVERAINDNKGYQSLFDVCWLVKANEQADTGKVGAPHMAYGAYYWIEGDNSRPFLRVGGFDDFPVAIARYQVIGGEAYGIGPGWYADSDTRQLFRILTEAFTNMEILGRPPLQASGGFKIDFKPGGVTRNTNPGEKVSSLFDIQPVFPQMFEVADRTREAINRAYNTNLFNMIGNDPHMNKTGRTAYEMALRNQEKMQLLGPVVERQNSEYLNVLVERLYNILERAGAFPPFPDEAIESLQGQEVEIRYVSPLAQAARASQIEPIEVTLNAVAQAAQLDPNIINVFDTLEYVYQTNEMAGAPIKILRSRQQYQAILEEKARSEAADKEAQMLMAAAPAMKDAAEAAQTVAGYES